MDIPERYEIGSLLGEGGFASVYSAYDLVTRKKVALKLIDKKIMRTNKLNDRVRNEVTDTACVFVCMCPCRCVP
jgi:serine/threonine protein kinase